MTNPTQTQGPAIVVGINYSELSRAALETALLAAERLGNVQLHALAVAEHEGPALAEDLSADAKQAFSDEGRRNLEAYVAGATRAVADGVQVIPHIAFGDPKTRLLELAHSVQAKLVVLGTHGRRGLERLLLGSVAENVIREAPCPVLVVRARDTHGEPCAVVAPRRLAVAVDFSPSSKAALLEAARWGARFKAELLVLHVLEPVQVIAAGSLGMVGQFEQPIENLTREHAAVRLDNFINDTFGATPEHVRAEIHEGSVRESVLREMERAGCDWLVAATHGRRGFERLLLGSVAEDLLRRCTCPVLAVHTGASVD